MGGGILMPVWDRFGLTSGTTVGGEKATDGNVDATICGTVVDKVGRSSGGGITPGAAVVCVNIDGPRRPPQRIGDTLSTRGTSKRTFYQCAPLNPLAAA